jgi:hypothetical protein
MPVNENMKVVSMFQESNGQTLGQNFFYVEIQFCKIIRVDKSIQTLTLKKSSYCNRKFTHSELPR